MTTISELQQRCGAAARNKGFHEDRPDNYTTADRRDLANWQGNKLMLIVSEVAEAQDELRKGHAADYTYYAEEHASGVHNYKPEGVPSELADVVIRVLDFCYTEGIDLEAIIEEKLRYNATRAYKHGKTF
jgi:NTP pyrophosphatase (non-canonical NTP hydrolase)